MPIDVQELIDNWEKVRNLVRASHRDSAISSLASLTDEKEVWEVFACLIGYSYETRQDLPAILYQIPDDLPMNLTAWQSAPFLQYAHGFNISPIYEFLPAVYTVKRKVGYVPILNVSEPQLERCLDKTSLEEYLKCISEQKREKEQKAFGVGADDAM